MKMKKLIVLLSILLIAVSSYAAYIVGEKVENYTFQDSDGGEPVTRTVQEVIDSGKLLIITWGYKG